jgi:hypothetical protein
MDDLAEVVVQFLRTSLDQRVVNPNESVELGLLEITLNQVLHCFGFEFAKVLGSGRNIQVRSAGASATGTNDVEVKAQRAVSFPGRQRV